MSLFKKEALERISSVEHLEQAATVVGVKGWLVLLFFILLTALVLAWSIVGSIPITASGNCIIFDPDSVISINSNVTARVKTIYVPLGEEVKKGQAVLLLEDPFLDQKVTDQKKIVSFLEQEIDQMTVGDVEDKKLQLLTEQERLQELEQMQKDLLITSPSEGSIAWININVGTRVTPDMQLMSIQGKFSAETLKIFGFAPLYSGQQIKPGMDVKMTLDTINVAKYGMIRGKVEEVLSYPTDIESYYVQKIPSQSLREYLVSGPLPMILVIVSPVLDEHTQSGFAWTSKEGAPVYIEPGMIGAFRVTLETIKPISYVLPSITTKE